MSSLEKLNTAIKQLRNALFVDVDQDQPIIFNLKARKHILDVASKCITEAYNRGYKDAEDFDAMMKA